MVVECGGPHLVTMCWAISRAPSSDNVLNHPQAPPSNNVLNHPQSPPNDNLLNHPQAPPSDNVLSHPQAPPSDNVLNHRQAPPTDNVLNHPQASGLLLSVGVPYCRAVLCRWSHNSIVGHLPALAIFSFQVPLQKSQLRIVFGGDASYVAISWRHLILWCIDISQRKLPLRCGHVNYIGEWLCFGNMEDVTFWWMEFYKPVSFPLFQSSQLSFKLWQSYMKLMVK